MTYLAKNKPNKIRINKTAIPVNSYGNVFIDDIKEPFFHYSDPKAYCACKKYKIPYTKCCRAVTKTGPKFYGIVIHKDNKHLIDKHLEEARNKELERINKKIEKQKIKEQKQYKEAIQKYPQFENILTLKNIWEFRFLEENLFNIGEAHPEWLNEMLDVVNINYEEGGILYQWDKGYLYNEENDECLEFFECLNRARAAYRRHNYTDYDEKLTSINNIIDYEHRQFMYRELKTEKTREGKQK